ncbi:MAG: hypothetical protein JWO48_2789 [Bryobacterales bacterium]|nr:hypothetical protein [Bryobacterales bacterium]
MRNCIVLVLMAGIVAGAEDKFSFQVVTPAEVVAELQMSSPGSDWAAPGREAAVALVSLDSTQWQHVTLYAGPAQHVYRVFLGRLEPGKHELSLTQSKEHSARGSALNVQSVQFKQITPGDPNFAVLANAPVLYARKNTIGKFSDVPLITYCERLPVEQGKSMLQYTVIFSNEDGGTSTRALMARWGRTTDIEYLYRAVVDKDGKVLSATIQAKNHQEIAFDGRRDGSHPELIPVTDNNMVAAGETSPIRYQMAPVLVDLTSHSREQVMDDYPITYQVMAKELVREGKLRPYGTLDGEKISDPRNYLYFEYRSTNVDGALGAMVKLRGEPRWRSSSLGRLDYAIARDGWVRTTVELPPGTKPEQIAEIGFECLVAVPEKQKSFAQTGTCKLESVSKTFLLGSDALPTPPVWSLSTPVEIPSGSLWTWQR